MADLSKLSANILASLKAIAAGDGKNKNAIDSQQEFNELSNLLANCTNQNDYDCILGLKISYQNKLQNNANNIAKEFYQIADDNSGLSSVKKISTLFDKKINANNIVAVLDAYQNSEIRHDDSSMIDTITSETGANTAERREALTKLINVLCEAAKNAGVSESDITSVKNSFITSMEKELGAHFRRTNPKDMEKAVDFLKGAILAKQNDIANMDEDTAMQVIAQNYQSQNAQASEDFETARKEEGWTAKTGDWVCGLFGCNTEDELRAKLGDNAKKVEKLITAANGGNKEVFKKVYKELFGIEFDTNKIAASEEYQERYLTAVSMNETNKAIDEILSQNLDYQQTINALKEKLKYDDETINQIIAQYNQPMETEAEKLALLKQFMTSTKENCTQELKYLTQGESLEQIANKAEFLAKAAFGTNDIAKDVTQFNENMVMTEMMTDAAFEIAGTIALQFVPGLGQAAAVKLAASAAKWGARGYKIAQGALKVGKGFRSANRLLTGQRFTSKAAQKGMQIGTQMVNAGTATAAVEFSSGKDMETAVKKIVMNMSFAGVGATSSMIAPKLMQTLGINRALANEIAEELINAAGSYGVSKAAGDEYGSTDFWTDMATGIIMARLMHLKNENSEINKIHNRKQNHNTKNTRHGAGVRIIQNNDYFLTKIIKPELKNKSLKDIKQEILQQNNRLQLTEELFDNLYNKLHGSNEIKNATIYSLLKMNDIDFEIAKSILNQVDSPEKTVLIYTLSRFDKEFNPYEIEQILINLQGKEFSLNYLETINTTVYNYKDLYNNKFLNKPSMQSFISELTEHIQTLEQLKAYNNILEIYNKYNNKLIGNTRLSSDEVFNIIDNIQTKQDWKTFHQILSNENKYDEFLDMNNINKMFLAYKNTSAKNKETIEKLLNRLDGLEDTEPITNLIVNISKADSTINEKMILEMFDNGHSCEEIAKIILLQEDKINPIVQKRINNGICDYDVAAFAEIECKSIFEEKALKYLLDYNLSILELSDNLSNQVIDALYAQKIIKNIKNKTDLNKLKECLSKQIDSEDILATLNNRNITKTESNINSVDLLIPNEWKIPKEQKELLLQLYAFSPKRALKIVNSGYFDKIIDISNVTQENLSLKMLDGLNKHTFFSKRTLSRVSSFNEPITKNYVKHIDDITQLNSISNFIENGDVFEFNKKLYINNNGIAEILDISPEVFVKLFPPLSSATFKQGDNGNCWFVTVLDNMMDKPAGKIELYKFFKQDGNIVTVQLPSSNIKIEFDIQKVFAPNSSQLHSENGIPLGLQMIELISAKNRYAQCCNIKETMSFSEINDYSSILSELDGGFELEAISMLLPKAKITKHVNDNLQSRQKIIDNIEMFANSEQHLLFFETKKDIEYNSEYKLFEDHAYSVKGFDKTKNIIYITNPHDVSLITEIPMSIFIKNINDLSIASIS